MSVLSKHESLREIRFPKSYLSISEVAACPLTVHHQSLPKATLALQFILIALFSVLPSFAALADDLIGQASIIDGDTIEIHGTRIRLWGVDAPEGTQLCRGEDSEQYRCGSQAANELYTFIAHRPVNCNPINLDQYGRTVATCSVGGLDIGEWLVQNGLALDWPRYSGGKYGPSSTKPKRPAVAFGKVATSSRGFTESASGPAAGLLIAPTTPTRIHSHCHLLAAKL